MVGWGCYRVSITDGKKKKNKKQIEARRLRVLHASVTISEIVSAREEFDYGSSELTFKFSRGRYFIFIPHPISN